MAKSIRNGTTQIEHTEILIVDEQPEHFEHRSCSFQWFGQSLIELAITNNRFFEAEEERYGIELKMVKSLAVVAK